MDLAKSGKTLIHARSLGLLEKARAFGMTQMKTQNSK